MRTIRGYNSTITIGKAIFNLQNGILKQKENPKANPWHTCKLCQGEFSQQNGEREEMQSKGFVFIGAPVGWVHVTSVCCEASDDGRHRF